MTYTREQIMAMSPDELWVAVAKAKEFFHVLNFGDHNCFVILSPYFSNVTMYRSETDAWNAAFENGRFPNWPASIADAWKLVESNPLPLDITLHKHTFGDGLYYVTVHTSRGSKSIYGVADTAPLAICRAWLMWKQEAQG